MDNEQDRAFRLPILAQVTASLRAEPRLASLPHAADLVSSYLDGSVLLTPPQATAHDSMHLLHRVLLRVMHDPTVDDGFRSHWLARAMEVAIKNNSLNAVQLIHRVYPNPLYVRSLQLALQHGTLKMAQWIIENRNDRRCCLPGIENLCKRCLDTALPSAISEHDTEAIVGWLASRGVDVTRVHGRQISMVRWLDERGYLDSERLLDVLICHGPPAVEIVSYLLEKGCKISEENLIGALARGASQRQLEPVIDVVVASPLCDSIRDKFVWGPTCAGGVSVLQWDADFLAETLVYGSIPMTQSVTFYAAHFCHVDTLKWLWDKRGVAPVDVPVRKPTTEQDLLSLYTWMHETVVDGWCSDDAACAARKGYLSVLKWIQEHKPDLLTEYTMTAAVSGGSMDVIVWLHENCSLGLGDHTLETAVWNGALAMVQWISTTYPLIEGDTNKAMITAARQDHLDVMVWLHDNRPDACGACVLRALLLGMNCPALPPLQWLTSNATRNAACVGRCCAPEPVRHDERHPSVPALALFDGDVDTARFLWQHHRASFNITPLRLIVQGGHLPAIQWLYSAARETINWDLVIDAAHEAGNITIADWVHSVRTGQGSTQ